MNIDLGEYEYQHPTPNMHRYRNPVTKVTIYVHKSQLDEDPPLRFRLWAEPLEDPE